MSGAEVAHRLGKVARNATGLLDITSTAVAPAANLARPDEPFLPNFADAKGLIDGATIVEAARRIVAGRHRVFDLTDCLLGELPEWNRDPLTQRLAPWRAAQRIDYRDEREVGNIKYLWEPNRHLHLPTLAQAYVLTGEPQFLRTLQAHLDSWFAQCPVGRGPNWVSSLELGIRLINWSITWQLLGAARAPLFQGPEGEEFRDRWLASIYQHARAITGNLSRFSSANNHLIGEAAGVFVAAQTWPYWNSMQEWGERCRSVLERECLHQNAPDGGNREQAMAYQQFVLDFLLLSGLAARRADNDFSAAYWDRLERMTDFIASFMDAAGHVPMIGDADDGFVVQLSHDPQVSPFTSLVATGAILFDRPDLASRAVTSGLHTGQVDAKTLTLLGADAADQFANLLARARGPYVPRREFPDCGYYLVGEEFETEREARVLMDAGPLGYLSLAAHGHADALSLQLNLAGREILIDPGTYAYHTDPAWRRYFRSTAAHNTVVVDGRDQSEQSGNFMWSRHAVARCLQYSSDGQAQLFAGEHDGYTALADPVVHRRAVRFEPGQLRISDSLRCTRPHSADRHWHFAEDLHVEVAPDGSIHVDAGRVKVTLRPDRAPDRVDVHRGAGPDEGGWVSRRFGVKTPCTTVIWRSQVSAAAFELGTLIEWTVSDAPA